MAKSFSTPLMKEISVPASTLGKKAPTDKESDDSALDFMKRQQRTALVETIDVLCHRSHIRQAVRDYAHGLLSAATQQRQALQEDHFATPPSTMGKVDEEFIAGYSAKHTQPSVSDISKCRAYDPKFASKFWLALMNSMAGCKLPEECWAKPILAAIANKRMSDLGTKFKDWKVDGRAIFENGKVNWARVGFFRVTVGANKVINTVTRLYSGFEVSVVDEKISADFAFENNWNPKSALLMKGSRKHFIMEFFSKQQQAAMQPWAGAPRGLADICRVIVEERKKDNETRNIMVDTDDLMKETNEKRSAAIRGAREKLLQAHEDSAKKHRVSAADGVDK